MSNEVEPALDIENRTIQAILKRVTRSDLCLICDVRFANEIAVQEHFLNVHHTGHFACNVYGCAHVAKTNGELRMHHCLWHYELFSSNFLLPQNPMVSLRHSGQMNNDDIGILSTEEFCIECSLTIHTNLGMKMHRGSHSLVTSMDRSKKMSDITSINELKKVLTDADADEKVKMENIWTAQNVLDFSSSCSINHERRQSKVRWDLMNNKTYEVPFAADVYQRKDRRVSPPPTPRALSPILISSDDELMNRLNEAESPRKIETNRKEMVEVNQRLSRLSLRKTLLERTKRPRAKSTVDQKKDRKNRRRHSSHQSKGY